MREDRSGRAKSPKKRKLLDVEDWRTSRYIRVNLCLTGDCDGVPTRYLQPKAPKRPAVVRALDMGEGAAVSSPGQRLLNWLIRGNARPANSSATTVRASSSVSLERKSKLPENVPSTSKPALFENNANVKSKVTRKTKSAQNNLTLEAKCAGVESNPLVRSSSVENSPRSECVKHLFENRRNGYTGSRKVPKDVSKSGGKVVKRERRLNKRKPNMAEDHSALAEFRDSVETEVVQTSGSEECDSLSPPLMGRTVKKLHTECSSGVVSPSKLVVQVDMTLQSLSSKWCISEDEIVNNLAKLKEKLDKFRFLSPLEDAILTENAEMSEEENTTIQSGDRENVPLGNRAILGGNSPGKGVAVDQRSVHENQLDCSCAFKRKVTVLGDCTKVTFNSNKCSCDSVKMTDFSPKAVLESRKHGDVASLGRISNSVVSRLLLFS